MKAQANPGTLQGGIILAAIVTALLLLVPLIAMQFTEEVNWSAWDFIVGGALIFLAGAGLVLAITKATRYRIAIGIGILALFAWIWVELAVGLFTNIGS